MTVNQIAERSTTYAGRRVTVRGEIVDVWTPRAFSIGNTYLPERDLGFKLDLAVKQLWRPELPIVIANEVRILPERVH